MATRAPLVSLKNCSLAELAEQMNRLGEPSFRATQIVKWLYQKRVDSFDGMKNIPAASRALYARYFSLAKLPQKYCIESKRRDAVKFGFETADNAGIIESVLLIDGERRTACVSSQMGCNLGCAFCETGRMGFVRNLSQEEILGQIIGINDYCDARSDAVVTNIVFMGMGEALSNFDAFLRALEIIQNKNAFFIGARRITVSTAGVVPSIERLMEQDLTIGLAISLNTYSNERRDAIMPVNKKYPIESIVDAARRYTDKTGRPVTFEYVVVRGDNDTPEAISSLVKLLSGVRCKINVIPVNPGNDFSGNAPEEKKLRAFADELVRRGCTATVRVSRGRDISGACGQLSGRTKINED